MKKFIVGSFLAASLSCGAQDLLQTDTNTIVTEAGGEQYGSPMGFQTGYYDLVGNFWYASEPMGWFWAGAGMVFSFWLFGWSVRIAKGVAGGHNMDAGS
jgi:hypothetical protein